MDLVPIDWIPGPKAILDAALKQQVLQVEPPVVEQLAGLVGLLAIQQNPFVPTHMGLL